jgi:hypothetical protein
MMTLTKVVLAGLGYALVKNRNQVAKELQKSNKSKVKAKPNTVQETINKSVTLDIKPDELGKIEKLILPIDVPERKIVCPESEKEPDKNLSKTAEYLMEQVSKAQHKNDNIKDIDTYVMDELNAEAERRKKALELEESEKKPLREKYQEHLYKNHVEDDRGDSKRIQNEIKERIDSSINAFEIDDSILKVVENAYMDFKSMNGGSYAINNSERNDLIKLIYNKNITIDAFQKIMDSEKHRNNSEFERVLKEKGLDKSIKRSHNDSEYSRPSLSWM